MFSFRLSIFVITLLVATLLAACGGGSSSEPQTGTVGIVITDLPSEDFDEINLKITRIELLGEDRRAVLFDEAVDGEREPVNLLNLRYYAELFIMGEAQVGDYSKIRLYIDQDVDPDDDQHCGIELVKQGEIICPSIPANGKIDLNPRQTFTVVPGGILYISLDIDANKSIHTHPTGNGDEYRFRPVVFVDVISEAFIGKLMRFYGQAQDVDVAAQSLRLCGPEPLIAPIDGESGNGDTEQGYCIAVDARAASMFREDGTPLAFDAELEDEDWLTAIGFIDPLPHEGDGTTGVATGVSHDDGNGVYSRVLLRAEVIEIGMRGTFETVPGTVSAAVDPEGIFALTLESEAERPVKVQQGTKIFTKSGVALTEQDLSAGTVVRIDGVDDGAGTLLAALIIVDDEPAAAIEMLSGSVVIVDEDNAQVVINTDAGQSVVLIDAETLVLQVDADGADGALGDGIDYTDLLEGQRVDVYGIPTASGFEATVVLALEVAAVPL